MNNKKKPVETSTVLITIAFLAIFIIMPPLCRMLYQEEEQPINNPDSGEVSNENITMTCVKSLSSGDSITSVSEFNSNQIITNKITLSSQVVIANITPENQSDAQEYNFLLNLIGNIQSENIEGDITNPNGNITLIINKKLFDSTKEETITNQFQDQTTLMNYYQEKGYQCS